MEFTLHFIFELIKICILGSLYATLTLIIFLIIGVFKRGFWINEGWKPKLGLWFGSGFIISVSLFLFMFTHYGDHGLGDSARIPLNHGREILLTDGIETYIQDYDNGISMLEVEGFYITDDFVYGLISDTDMNYHSYYFIYDLKQNLIESFDIRMDFENRLKELGLNANVKYRSFGYYYYKYWSGWRFWLLP